MTIEGVLDASAVLAILLGEPGQEVAESWLNRSYITTVNLTEVLSRVQKEGAPFEQSAMLLDQLRISTLDFDSILARGAARLAPVGWKIGLSLGDRACLAAALQLGLTAVTADRSWKKLSIKCPIVLIR